jgi:hypothetical protein
MVRSSKVQPVLPLNSSATTPSQVVYPEAYPSRQKPQPFGDFLQIQHAKAGEEKLFRIESTTTSTRSRRHRVIATSSRFRNVPNSDKYSAEAQEIPALLPLECRRRSGMCSGNGIVDEILRTVAACTAPNAIGS